MIESFGYRSVGENVVSRDKNIENRNQKFSNFQLYKYYNFMNIKEIYDYFSIPQPLQQHMIDVASVAQMICDHWKGEKIDAKRIVVAALLHDLGNIIKIDFSIHGAFYQQDIHHRTIVKQSMIEKYGNNCHDATSMMIEELGNPYKVIELVDTVGISGFLEHNYGIAAHIVDYADMRVDLYGITTMDARLLNAKKRYTGRIQRADDDVFAVVWENAHRVEQEIFSSCNLQA
jgi:hypothetical protein